MWAPMTPTMIAETMKQDAHVLGGGLTALLADALGDGPARLEADERLDALLRKVSCAVVMRSDIECAPWQIG